MAWRVLITDGLEPAGQAILREEAELVQSELDDALDEVDALIVRSRTHVSRAAIARGRPKLRVIGRAGVGVDNIDLQAAEELGVIVVNAPQAASISVAEHTLAMMLALARQLPQADASMRRHEWKKSEFIGTELNGKTLGLIGIGRIGALVAERAAAFGMTIMAYDPALTASQIATHGAEGVDFETLLQQSDIISLHVPLTDETANLIDSRAFGQLKPGVWIICTSRGGIVNEQALLAGLESGAVGAAALDVFEHEPPGASGLIGHPNVILTPHIAGQTQEAQAQVAVDVATEVLAALRGESLRWRVI